MSKGQGKLLTKRLIKVREQNRNQGMFLNSLSWLDKRNLCLKIFFLSQYLFISILCAKMSRVNKASAFNHLKKMIGKKFQSPF